MTARAGLATIELTASLIASASLSLVGGLSLRRIMRPRPATLRARRR